MRVNIANKEEYFSIFLSGEYLILVYWRNLKYNVEKAITIHLSNGVRNHKILSKKFFDSNPIQHLTLGFIQSFSANPVRQVEIDSGFLLKIREFLAEELPNWSLDSSSRQINYYIKTIDKLIKETSNP